MELISPSKKQFKANLHCHSTLSDGKKTPQELKEMYRERGYQILAITDHERPFCHADLDDEDFLTVTGYEVYIRDREDARYDPYAKEVHLNLFARGQDNVKAVCYQRQYYKYVPAEEQEALEKVGSTLPRTRTAEYVNELIRTATENGYLVAYNHPWWSMESEEEILSYEGIFSLEMCNYGSYLSSGLMEYGGAIYDKMLRAGKRVFCHAGDDNHNHHPVDSVGCDSFGAFTMILADSLDYASVLAAMERGDMYSSMGPVFHSVRIEEDCVFIRCSEVERILLQSGSKAPKSAFAPKGGSLTEACLPIDPRAPYVRVTIVDACGRAADTRAVFRSEFSS